VSSTAAGAAASGAAVSVVASEAGVSSCAKTVAVENNVNVTTAKIAKSFFIIKTLIFELVLYC
ncbi:MAG: hypothetical protein RR550_03795, partial [Rikenellaceae bacterium]